MLSGQFDGPIAVGGEAVNLQGSQSTIYNSGRPVEQSDAFVAAWLPGTEGQGVADVLFGEYPFTGKLPYTWPRSIDQIPFDFADGKISGHG